MAIDIKTTDEGICIVDTEGGSLWGMPYPTTIGQPMTPMEADKLADKIRAAVRKARSKPQPKKLGEY